ncbi:hypothetical protein Tcan_04479 [Toxocara canis]|uniref:Uncharacterized protein n=1 Tax=Toxocara canis TaxID=6265 RepID=A0A0B2V447_TOXCA|nr:hypothetical protein Tcan_04479 [Toxocara canis]
MHGFMDSFMDSVCDSWTVFDDDKNPLVQLAHLAKQLIGRDTTLTSITLNSTNQCVMECNRAS